MSSKTKIIVLHMKEVIYTVIFLLLAILLGVLIFFMFGPGHAAFTFGKTAARYTPGVYRSSIHLNDNTFDVEVTVNADRIQALDLANLSETTAAAYPLMKPALDELSSQILSSQSLEDITYPEDQKYTSQVLINAIRDALEQADPITD